MNKIILCLFLLYNYVYSSDNILQSLLNESIEIIPEKVKTVFQINYPTYTVVFNNIRFFNAITDDMIITEQETSIQAEKVILTVATNIKLDIGKTYDYHDFLIEFNLTKLIIKENQENNTYVIDTIDFQDIFISPQHDLGSSKYFNQLKTDQDSQIKNNFKQILYDKFSTIILVKNLNKELKEILEIMKRDIVNYQLFNIVCNTLKYTFLNFKGFIMTFHLKPIFSENILKTTAEIDLAFQIDNLQTGVIREDKHTITAEYLYKMTDNFTMTITNSKDLPKCLLNQNIINIIIGLFEKTRNDYYAGKSSTDINNNLCLSSSLLLLSNR